MTVVYTIAIILGLLIFVGLYFYLKYFVPLRPNESGFKYVYVEEDGTVREIDNEDEEYLKTKFSPTDGARPYIKSRYDELTPDKKISGFILRSRVPKKMEIKSIEKISESRTISWIFMALAMASESSPADIKEIKMIADGINHAVPNENEIQFSIKWLLNNDFIREEGRKYTLNALGKSVYGSATEGETLIMKIWSKLENEIKNMHNMH